MKTYKQATQLILDLLNEEFTGSRTIELLDEGQGTTWSGVIIWEFKNDLFIEIELNVNWQEEFSPASYDTPADSVKYNQEIEFLSVVLTQDHQDIAIEVVLRNITEKLAEKLTSKIDLV